MVVNKPFGVADQYRVSGISLEAVVECKRIKVLWSLIESGSVKDSLSHCQVLFCQRVWSLRLESYFVRGPWIRVRRGRELESHLSV